MWQRLLFLAGVLLSANSALQAQWTLAKDEKGIQVYTSDAGTSQVKSIKAVATLKGSCQQLVSLFRDIEKQTQWVYATRQAYLLNKVSDNELLYYVETVLPWPVKNRDTAVRMKIDQNDAGNRVKITTTGEPKAMPIQKGKVRVPMFKGIWEVKDAGNGEIRIVYLLDLDPGGSLPAGVTNLFVARGPHETFINLSRLLGK